MLINFPKLEEKILKFWEKNRIFEKSISQRKGGPFFSFYDGPPFATGKPHYGHILATTIKDTVLRYFTMKGYQTPRRLGWDCHGLPVENLIEKELGIKNKKEIENFGIGKFNQACRNSVFRCVEDFERTLKRVGRWADYRNAYTTLDNNYIESVWWVLKKLWQAGLVYKDYRVSPFCPRCGTPLSNFEVNQGYKEVKDNSLYLKFKIKELKFKNSYFLVWTTTAWTLPGNLALAIEPKADYLLVKQKEETYVLTKERISILSGQYKIIKKFKGKELVGLKYEPLFNSLSNLKIENIENAFRVLPAKFVSIKEGSGIVHIAPMYGQDDFQLAKKHHLPFYHTVDESGLFKNEVKEWAGQFVKAVEPKIINNLEKLNLLYKKEEILHSYPFCWRCDTPLFYYALDSWYIRVQKIKKQLIKNNKKIHWLPKHLKQGRFGKWLEEAKDWAFSRTRFWGAPLPIWQCPNCQNLKVIGSLKNLLSQNFSKNNFYLFRHGHSIRQIKNLAMCWPEKIYCPLTEKGKKETRAAAKKIKNNLAYQQAGKIDFIFSSDLLRTKQTAEILAKETGIKVIYDKRLREYNVGIFNGKKPELVYQYLKKQKNFTFARLPKGESLTEVGKRIFNFLKETNEKYQNKNILIVSHEFPLTILTGVLKGWPIEKIIKLRKENKIKTIQTAESQKIKFRNLPYNEKMELDFHRPYIDEVFFKCQFCQGKLQRVSEVFDCWFESGSMPYGQRHYPFENKKLVEKTFPADFIAEGLDQTRGWFYTLHVIATALTIKNIGLGKNQPAFKNVIVNGLILDHQGRKLSKKLGNYPEPNEIFNSYGADSLRYFLLASTPIGEDYRFSSEKVEEIWRKFLSTLWNSYLFFNTYKEKKFQPKKNFPITNVLNEWIVSRVNQLNDEIVKWLDQYELSKAIRLFNDFIDDFSNWYIRRSRVKFQKEGDEKIKEEFSQTLHYVLLKTIELLAPFMPFISEELYQQLGGEKESVHLADYPKAKKELINKKLAEKMKKVREITTLALAERAKEKIKVRQPLNELRITNYELRREKELLDLIKEEVNVKEIVFGKTFKLDAKITPELKEEGAVREVIRQIQEMRKKAGLKPKDKISVQYFGRQELNNLLTKNKPFILKETRAKDFHLDKKLKKVFLVERETKVNQQELWLAIKKF
ncbi:MAG: class I tRNA ligase family protein [Candidatus Nealsonbacteria bacterium]|nr:class I tRNA ligase family protein [Candidatus Nealsonbacteria bacterium]